MKNLKENGDPNITTILVGNKIDLHDKRVILEIFSINNFLKIR